MTKLNLLYLKILRNFPFLFSDKTFLKLVYKIRMGKSLDLSKPKTFNEKIQWLKLYFRKPILTELVDKIKVKKYIKTKIGSEYIIPTLGEWDSFAQINFDELPNQFVLKTNHDSGGIVICKDKTTFDYKKAEEKLNKHLKKNHFYKNREWAYKNVKPRILCEKYLAEMDDDLIDYKFYCFNGNPELLLVMSDRMKQDSKVKMGFYDMEFKKIEMTKAEKESIVNMVRPSNFEKMVQISKSLSESFPFIRVDLYNIEGKILFGELTLYPHGGFGEFNPEEWDYKLGEYIKLCK